LSFIDETQTDTSGSTQSPGHWPTKSNRSCERTRGGISSQSGPKVHSCQWNVFLSETLLSIFEKLGWIYWLLSHPCRYLCPDCDKYVTKLLAALKWHNFLPIPGYELQDHIRGGNAPRTNILIAIKTTFWPLHIWHLKPRDHSDQSVINTQLAISNGHYVPPTVSMWA